MIAQQSYLLLHFLLSSDLLQALEHLHLVGAELAEHARHGPAEAPVAAVLRAVAREHAVAVGVAARQQRHLARDHHLSVNTASKHTVNILFSEICSNIVLKYFLV